jgi:hypothetical protein
MLEIQCKNLTENHFISQLQILINTNYSDVTERSLEGFSTIMVNTYSIFHFESMFKLLFRNLASGK